MSAAERPWTSESDPATRARWYSDAELEAVKVVATGLDDGRYYVIVAGDLLGTVGPARAGWPSHRRSGVRVQRGHIRRTRARAVAELVDAVHRAWQARTSTS